MITVGAYVEISPAFNGETGQQDIYDEVAGCAGWITAINTVRDEACVQLRNGDEYWIAWRRLRMRATV